MYLNDFNNEPVNNQLTFADKRLISYDYIPSSVKAGGYEGIEYTSFSTYNTTINNNSITTVVHSLTFTSTEAAVVEWDIAIFAGGNLVPSAAAGSGNWLLWGPMSTPYDTLGNRINDNQRAVRIGVLNRSGSNYSVTFEFRDRYILNKGGESAGTEG